MSYGDQRSRFLKNPEKQRLNGNFTLDDFDEFANVDRTVKQKTYEGLYAPSSSSSQPPTYKQTYYPPQHNSGRIQEEPIDNTYKLHGKRTGVELSQSSQWGSESDANAILKQLASKPLKSTIRRKSIGMSAGTYITYRKPPAMYEDKMTSDESPPDDEGTPFEPSPRRRVNHKRDRYPMARKSTPPLSDISDDDTAIFKNITRRKQPVRRDSSLGTIIHRPSDMAEMRHEPESQTLYTKQPSESPLHGRLDTIETPPLSDRQMRFMRNHEGTIMNMDTPKEPFRSETSPTDISPIPVPNYEMSNHLLSNLDELKFENDRKRKTPPLNPQYNMHEENQQERLHRLSVDPSRPSYAGPKENQYNMPIPNQPKANDNMPQPPLPSPPINYQYPEPADDVSMNIPSDNEDMRQPSEQGRSSVDIGSPGGVDLPSDDDEEVPEDRYEDEEQPYEEEVYEEGDVMYDSQDSEFNEYDRRHGYDHELPDYAKKRRYRKSRKYNRTPSPTIEESLDDEATPEPEYTFDRHAAITQTPGGKKYVPISDSQPIYVPRYKTESDIRRMVRAQERLDEQEDDSFELSPDEMSDTPLPNRRPSRRRKMRPLAHWCNEKLGPDEHTILRPTRYTAPLRKSKSKSVPKETVVDHKKGMFDIANGDGTQIVSKLIAATDRMIEYSDVSYEEVDGKISYATVFQNDKIKCGHLIVYGHSRRPEVNVRSQSVIHFHVLMGRVNVQIQDNEPFPMGKGDWFNVAAPNSYALENPSKRDCKLVFFSTKFPRKKNKETETDDHLVSDDLDIEKELEETLNRVQEKNNTVTNTPTQTERDNDPTTSTPVQPSTLQ